MLILGAPPQCPGLYVSSLCRRQVLSFAMSCRPAHAVHPRYFDREVTALMWDAEHDASRQKPQKGIIKPQCREAV